MQSVLAKIALCRTAALGGRSYQCDDCGAKTERYHSCGDRHCPICSGRKRYDFAERASQHLLPGVTYYQVVFTLPQELSELALANRLKMADLLIHSSWKALQKTIRQQQNFDPAAMMVLHTWNQRLDPHWHAHALVPGGGLCLTTNRWKFAEAPTEVANDDGYYLVDAISLRESFRKSAMARLHHLYQSGQLKLEGKFAALQDAEAWQAFCERLRSVDWVSSIHPPPSASSSVDNVVRYLTRYLTGGPISDRRIVSTDDDRVTFLARAGTRTGGDREQTEVTLSQSEFIRRWCLHIQPEQLTKTRYFGGWSNTRRGEYMARCRADLEPTLPPEDVLGVACEEVDSLEGEVADDGGPRCPACQALSLRCIGERAKPRWAELLHHRHPDCPGWYAAQRKAELERDLWAEYGVGYDDWCLAMGIESAREPPVRLRQTQPLLPGILPLRDYHLESL